MVTSIAHTLFLIVCLVIALIPITMVVGRAAIIAWVAWASAWGVLAVLTTADVFVFKPQILRLAAHLGGQIAVGVILFLLVPAIRRAVRAVSLEALVRWQIARITGGFFLIGAAMGEVSAPFAFIAGTGDVLVGLAAARTWRKCRPVMPRHWPAGTRSLALQTLRLRLALPF